MSGMLRPRPAGSSGLICCSELAFSTPRYVQITIGRSLRFLTRTQIMKQTVFKAPTGRIWIKRNYVHRDLGPKTPRNTRMKGPTLQWMCSFLFEYAQLRVKAPSTNVQFLSWVFVSKWVSLMTSYCVLSIYELAVPLGFLNHISRSAQKVVLWKNIKVRALPEERVISCLCRSLIGSLVTGFTWSFQDLI